MSQQLTDQPSTFANNDAWTARLRRILDLHFHPTHGSVYWLNRQEKLGWDVRDRIRSMDDLHLLGPTPVQDLRDHSVQQFIPRGLHRQLPRFILGETAGTSGSPCCTAYRDDEFQAAFIEPFLRVAQATGFPREQPWLWIGPSGPHIIGKAVRELARQMGSMDPFSVDFDPRWARRLVPGSLARNRYLEHVTSQALEILRREEIGVLFTTPPTLTALARLMTEQQREAIRGVHYGGLSMALETVNQFRLLFPNAVHLSGYGNTLFGVLMEVEDGPRQALDYYPLGERLQFQMVSPGPVASGWPLRACPPGETGRVLFHRLDESFLLINVLERDAATAIAPSAVARQLGCQTVGIRNPGIPPELVTQLPDGLY